MKIDYSLLMYLHHIGYDQKLLIFLDKSVLKGIGHCFEPAMNLELIENILNMVSDGSRTNKQGRGNFGGAKPLG